jgi:FkbM family methyltransferase
MHFVSFSTKNKIKIAQTLHRVIRLARKCCGMPMQGKFKRGGLYWELNLDEGIDFAIWLLGSFERDMLRVYSKLLKPGSHVLDIGANIGAHTLPLAKLVGNDGVVVAIEATTYAFEKLVTNLNLNPDCSHQVIPIQALLISGELALPQTHLHSSWPLVDNSTVHPILGGKLKSLDSAQVTTGDELIQKLQLKKIDWIKLDVDGNELTVLKGINNIVANHRPHILLELAPYCHSHKSGQFEELINHLLNLNYTLLNADSLRPLSSNLNTILSSIPINGSINVYAKPLKY